MANQVNSVGLAYGGCERVCQMMDETSEVDDGYVTLVRAKYDEQRRRSYKTKSDNLGLETSYC